MIMGYVLEVWTMKTIVKTIHFFQLGQAVARDSGQSISRSMTRLSSVCPGAISSDDTISFAWIPIQMPCDVEDMGERDFSVPLSCGPIGTRVSSTQRSVAIVSLLK